MGKGRKGRGVKRKSERHNGADMIVNSKRKTEREIETEREREKEREREREKERERER